MSHRNPGFISRRGFLKAGAATVGAAPFIWTARVQGAVPATDRITVGIIGTGRMGHGDLKNILGFDTVQVVAVCDVDAHRRADAKRLVETRYAKRSANGRFKGCRETGDFREIVTSPDIDAVMVCTPDNWHALPAIAAARAGKDIFIQKPLTYTIEEGRVLSDAVREAGVILQVGSQQRSATHFRFACELVRNGRIGKLERVEVGCGIDPWGPNEPVTSPPDWLDYDFWLGPAPARPYIEKHVHPRHGYSRPGWLRTRDYCLGMMTGWGAHHMDIAHWGMGFEEGGPETIEGWAEYPPDGVWDVHGRWDVHYTYPGGIDLYFGDNLRYKQGVVFYGTDGWVHVRRGFIDAHPNSLLKETIGPGEIHLYESHNHMGNFVECMRTRRQPVAPVEIGHRSCTACILADIAARLGRKLRWNAKTERFFHDETANRRISRPMRAPWHL